MQGYILWANIFGKIDFELGVSYMSHVACVHELVK